MLLCPSYDSEKAPFSSRELRKAPSLLRGLNLALLCVILFFSSPSCLYSPTRTQVSVRTPLGLPTPQAGSGMEKRGPVHASVDVTSGFQWFRSVTDRFEDLPREMHSWVFVCPHTHTVLYTILSCLWTSLMSSLMTPREELLKPLNPFILYRSILRPREGKHPARGHTAH